MKKSIFLFLFVWFCACLPAQNIHYYGFEAEKGAYEPIPEQALTLLGQKKFEALQTSGATNLSINNLILSGDSAYTNRICGMAEIAACPIGFDFLYAGRTFRYFHVLSNGALIFGESEKMGIMSTGAFLQSDCADLDYAVYCMLDNVEMLSRSGTEDDFHTSIGYSTLGNPGSRVLTVQYSNLVSRGTGWIVSDTLSFQFRLYESDGRLEICFGSFTTHGKDLTIGLRGTAKDNLITAKILLPGESWMQPVVSDTLTSSKTNPNHFKVSYTAEDHPEEGLVYGFIRPAACETPDMVSQLEIQRVGSDCIEGVFETEASSMVLVCVPSSEESLPVSAYIEDGKEYEDGQILDEESGAFFGGRFRARNGSFKIDGLAPTTDYTVLAYACNDECSGGPLYSPFPVEQKARTLYAAPQVVSVFPDTTFAQLTYATEDGTQLLVAFSEGRITDIILPDGIIEEGDEIAPGVRIIHKGETGPVRVENLKENTPYHVYAWTFTESHENAVYSSLYTETSFRTAGTLPCFWSFDEETPKTLPVGWTNRSGIPFLIEKSGGDMFGNGAILSLEAAFAGGKTDTASVETPGVRLEKGKHRFTFSLTFITKGFNEMGYKPGAGDTVHIGVSFDNGLTWETIYSVHAQNYTMASTSFTVKECPFYSPESSVARFRVHVVSSNKFNVRIKDVNTEYVGDCDSPINIATIDSVLAADRVGVQWALREDAVAQSYEVSCRAIFDSVWSGSVSTREQKAILDELASGTPYRIRVRSVCGLESKSAWKEMDASVKTLYAVPFREHIDDWSEAIPDYFGIAANFTVPEGESVRVNTVNHSMDWKLAPAPWSQDEADLSIAHELLGNYGYFLPVIYLEREASFDFTFSILNNLDPPVIPDESMEASLAVFVSVDSGRTVDSDHMLAKWGTGTEFPLTTLDRVSAHIDLSPFAGQYVRLAFAIASGSLKQDKLTVFIDDMEIGYQCPDPENLSAIPGEDRVELRWDAADSAIGWTWRIRKAGETDSGYRTGETRSPSVVIENLEPSTEYEYGVAASCAGDRESAYSKGYFTTLVPYVCPGVSSVRTAVGKRAITVSWEGESPLYRVRYRLTGENDWQYKESETNTIVLTGLEPDGMEYEISIQSVCSPKEGDTSLWSAVVYGQTAFITCAIPEDISVKAGDTTAEIHFVSEADRNELELVSGSDTLRTFIASGDITGGLQPETAYSIRLRAVCMAGDTSEWSMAVNFETEALEPLSLSLSLSDRISVSGKEGVVRILNPEGLPIRRIEIYDLTGRELLVEGATRNETILLASKVRKALLLVRIVGFSGETGVYRVYVD